MAIRKDIIQKDIAEQRKIIDGITMDLQVIRKYAANSRNAYDLMIELKERIQEINDEISIIIAYAHEHYNDFKEEELNGR